MPLPSFEELAKILQASDAKNGGEWCAIINPEIWSGYWRIKRTVPFFRWLGRKLHSRRIYWLGLQIRWIEGIKDWYAGEVCSLGYELEN